MQVTIVSGISGAHHARGLSVLIDVFRGSSTIVSLFAAGAHRVIPVASLQEALRLKTENPHYFLVGEIKGKTPIGFDCGNSPFKVSFLDLRQKCVIFRSSAASKGILAACRHAKISELLIGGFVNANSVIKYIKDKSPKEVTLIAIGTLGFGPWRKASEDEYCAEYMKKLLEGKAVNFSEIKNKILEKEGAARLTKLGQDQDLKICLDLNLFSGIVPKVKKSKLGMKIWIER